MDQKVTKHPNAFYHWEFESAADRVFARNYVDYDDLGRVALQLDNGTFWVLRSTADITIPAVTEEVEGETVVLVPEHVDPVNRTPVWLQIGGPIVAPNGSAFTLGVDNDGNTKTTSI